MLMAILAAILVLTVPLFGGRLRALAQVRVRSFWLIGVALVLQVLAISVVPTWPHLLLVSAHLLSYVMAGWFVFLNRKVSGLPIVALGGALNAITIAVNGGTLPASRSALATAGIRPVAGVFNNSGVLAHPHLAWLGDIIPVPASVPMANVFSIGDLLILVGLAYGLHHLCSTRLVRSSRRQRVEAAESWRRQGDGEAPTVGDDVPVTRFRVAMPRRMGSRPDRYRVAG